MTVLYEIGFENLNSFDELLQEIKEKDIEVVVDIRYSTKSKKSFLCKKELSKNLNSNNIEYYHFKELGFKNHSEHGKHKEVSFELLEDYYSNLLRNETLVSKLIMISRVKKTCILCFDLDRDKCIRTVLGFYISSLFNSSIKKR